MFLFVFFLSCHSFSFKISHLNALLQFKDPNSPKTPHFTISAEGSCVNWTSLNPSVVRVIPNYATPRCSTSALVESVAFGPKRKATSILAESESGSSLKCDVFVDSIVNLTILTTTKTIYVDSSLETLSLQASDSENNVFTSLEGTDVQWNIDSVHLRTVNPADAKVALPGVSPNKSASVIVQGTNVGKTWARATLDGKYKAFVELVVVEPLSLFPSPIVRTLPYHHIPFMLCSTRELYEPPNSQDEISNRKCVSKIQLPSQKYALETTNPNVLTTDQSGYASTFKPGQATIMALDSTTGDGSASTLVIVTYPVVSLPEQYIALGDDPVFDPVLKDQDGNLLDLFEPVNWEIIGDWSTVGRKEITLKYHDFSFIAIVHVCPPVYMDPPEAVLPLRHTGFVVMPHGGSGFYEFRVENSLILDYSNNRVSTIREGTTKIIVQDRKIKKFNNFSEILVSKVAFVDIQLERRELINEPFEPVCSVYAIEQKQFSVEVPYRTITSSPDVVSSLMRPQHYGFADIYCEASGTSSPKIKVSVADNLRVSVKGRGSPNSIIPLTVSGGVLQWPDSPPPKIQVSCPDANVTNLYNNHFSIDREYSGMCEARMQNTATDKNPIPLEVTGVFWLNVSKVDRLDLYVVDDKASDDPVCNSPPRILLPQIIPPKSYRIVPGHPHKLAVFPRDIQNNIINYYSAVPFELRASFNNELIKPLDNHGKDGETNYIFTPSTTTDLTLISPDLPVTIVSLNEITPILLQSIQTVYYFPEHNYSFSVEGGSGFYASSAPNVSFSNGRLFISPTSPGTFIIPVIDKCTDHPPSYATLNALTVVSLSIISPPSVAVNSFFDATIKVYGHDSILLPDELLYDANVTLHFNPNEILKGGENTPLSNYEYRLNPKKVGKLQLIAVAENNVSATSVVDVIEGIRIEPQYIELLPGDSQLVKVISGPSDILLDFGDGLISKVLRHPTNPSLFEVVAESPGYIIINATSRNVPGIEPFPIYVHVLKPISLRIDSTSIVPIQTGYVGLKLFVETDAGDRIPKKAHWFVTDSYRHILFNSSFALLNCSQPNDVRVNVEAYSLTTTYTANVEPKLILTTPQTLLLPPLCSFQIETVGNLRCTFHSLNETIVTCENGLVTSGTVDGETFVCVEYGSQTAMIHVRVSKPVFLYLHQPSPSDFRVMLLDEHGLLYDTLNGVKFTINGPPGFETSGIDSHGFCKTQYISTQMITLNASASNSEFSLETSINVSVRQKITPEHVSLIKGTQFQFKCTALEPRWHTSDRTIAVVDSHGLLTTKRPGAIRLSCGPGIEQVVTVVDIVNLQISNGVNDEYEIHPIYSTPVPPGQLVGPSDLAFSCELPSVCGEVEYKKNQTGSFCIIKRDTSKQSKSKCPPKTKLKATVYSETSSISFSVEAQISYIGTVDFGVPNNLKFTVTPTKRKIEIPILPKQSELNVESSTGLTVDFEPQLGIIIRADDRFTKSGFVKLEHIETGETVTIEVIHESSPSQQQPVLHTRDFKLSQDLIFYTSLITLFASIFFIILKVTSQD